MQKSQSKLPLVLGGTLLAALMGVVGYTAWNATRQLPNVSVMTLPVVSPSPSAAMENREVTPDPDWKTHQVADLDLTFSAPPEMRVTSETQKVEETGQPYLTTMFVERGTANNADYYQLYGIIQWDSQFSADSLNEYKEVLEPSSIREVTVSGYKALEGQIIGQRNRFVTYILTDKGILTLFTAQPTAENKSLTDQIMGTFMFKK